MIICFSYTEPENEFKDETPQRDQLLMLLRDLGMGKETQFRYPWRPDKSPDFCKNADNQHGGWMKDAYIEFNTEDGKKGYPGKACNEFIFTRA